MHEFKIKFQIQHSNIVRAIMTITKTMCTHRYNIKTRFDNYPNQQRGTRISGLYQLQRPAQPFYTDGWPQPPSM